MQTKRKNSYIIIAIKDWNAKIGDQMEGGWGIQSDWSCGPIVKLSKKGDLTEYGNWGGISIMSVPAKVMGE